jgi:hypothetical protein
VVVEHRLRRGRRIGRGDPGVEEFGELLVGVLHGATGDVQQVGDRPLPVQQREQAPRTGADGDGNLPGPRDHAEDAHRPQVRTAQGSDHLLATPRLLQHLGGGQGELGGRALSGVVGPETEGAGGGSRQLQHAIDGVVTEHRCDLTCGEVRAADQQLGEAGVPAQRPVRFQHLEQCGGVQSPHAEQAPGQTGPATIHGGSPDAAVDELDAPWAVVGDDLEQPRLRVVGQDPQHGRQRELGEIPGEHGHHPAHERQAAAASRVAPLAVMLASVAVARRWHPGQGRRRCVPGRGAAGVTHPSAQEVAHLSALGPHGDVRGC